MKKIYTTILSTLFCCGAVMAQEANTFAFTYNGEVLANGATVVIAEYEDFDGIYEMSAPLNVKNVSDDACELTLACTGKENYEDIQFCPNGNCQPWPASGELTCTYKNALEAGAMAETTNWLHATLFDDPTEYVAQIELKAYASLDTDDCVTVTVRFDGKGQQGVVNLSKVKAAKNIEVYNLCGKKIAETTVGLTKGIYIIKQGSSSRKVVIK